MRGVEINKHLAIMGLPHPTVLKTLLLYLNLLYAFTEICMTSSLLMVEVFVIQLLPEIS